MKLTFDQDTLISVITITMLNPIFCPNVNKHLSSCSSCHGCRALFICLHRHKSFNFYALIIAVSVLLRVVFVDQQARVNYLKVSLPVDLPTQLRPRARTHVSPAHRER